ncbi:uncharacterized protein LAESUDRAFT_671692 [Laetiporus sulphureus 93-53]|uniref:Cytokinin riboside 5'-monophosphate phosphoribohydrolase n=1 Tax=Laetiporus sulphureus 93-53 TaxID=1314785 RepID=A0A165HD48_9APHY|nr:uncharacterized protein LAESUDRAFT_671692 [Laetiporus sulphureus 93-53]KZT11575.1 hypothetical protein LAESUDRAFT_671692 [Laetiporus sulphureus 93-53]
MQPPITRAVAVYCASSCGRQQAFIQAARSLGTALAKAKRPLVYGGGSLGIMGAVSGAASEAGGDVTGIVPYAMVAAGGEVDQVANRRGPAVLLNEKGRERVETIVVNSMHERKTEMARKSCGFIALPGGYGTFEEVLEAICWTQLGIHEKPIIVMNVLGFFNPLRELIRNGVCEGFIAPQNEALVQFVDGPSDHSAHDSFDWGKAAVDALDSWRPAPQTHFYDWTKKKGSDGERTDVDALEAA